MDTDQTISFKKRVQKATMWLGGLTMIGQAITWGATVIVIRLLRPQDYGLLAMATVFLGFMTTLSELGLGAALIQKEEVSRTERKQAAGFVLLINLTMVIVLYLSAPLIGAYYNEARLIPVVRVLSLNFILLSFYTIPRAMLVRGLDFRRKSTIDLLANLTNSGVVLILALYDFGVWALVSGMVSANVFKAVAFNLFSPDRCLPSFSFRGMLPMLSFGVHMTMTSILWYLYSQSDILIGGRMLGKALIGVYAVSMQLISMPISKVTPLISQIGFSASSRMQTEMPAIQTNFLRLVKFVNTLSFPLFIGFALVADKAIPILLGPKWLPAVVPMELLALVMPLRFISVLFMPIINGLGYPRVNTGNMAFAIVIMPLAFLIGARWGIFGFCLAWLTVYPFLFIIICRRSLGVMQLPMRAIWKTMVVPLTGSLVMGLVVFGLDILLGHRLPKPVLLSLLVTGGAAAYTLAVFACNREILKEMKAFALAP